MNEIGKGIEGYEGLYDMTISGRIYSVKKQKFKERCNDEYGFHLVDLYKQGKRERHNVFELWKKTFINLPESEFKGALKVKYK